MPRNDEDALMRAQLALMELEQPERDDNGEIKDKHYWAHHLKISGLTWNEVARRLGYSSPQAAHRAAQIYLSDQAVALSNQDRQEWLETQLSRCESMIKQYWKAAQLGDTDAAQLVLKYMQEEAKYARLYEEASGGSNTQYVVINAGREKYATELKRIALGPKALTMTDSEE